MQIKMKAKYLLSALAISTAFVACNNEDLSVNESVKSNGKEIVGEELLGAGLSINISAEDGSASRATAKGWAEGDVAGLGWVVKDDPFSKQGGVEIEEVGQTLFANHYYQYDGKAWNTKTNIYKGWHFAYFPWTYQEEPKELVFYVNKDKNGKNHVFALKDADKLDASGGEAYKADISNNAPHLSAAAMLDASKVDASQGTITERFSVERVVNVLLPELKIDDAFKGEYLKNFVIKSIKLGFDEIMFTKTMTVNPAALPENVYVNGEFNSTETRKKLLKNLIVSKHSAEDQRAGGAILICEGYVKSQTTELTEEFTLAQDHLLRMFIAPVTSNRNPKEAAFTITLEDGSKFIVEAEQEENKEAMDRVTALFSTSGYKHTNNNIYSFRSLTYGNKEKISPAHRIALQLNKENFIPNYNITEASDWARCVALANALEDEAPIFTVTNDVVIEFGDAEEMLAPAYGVTIETEGDAKAILKVVGNTSWNEGIQIDGDVTVQVGDAQDAEINKKAILTVLDETLSAEKVVNYANINAGASSTLGCKEGTQFDNFGTVTIEYNALVYPTVTSTGYVAYKLQPTDGVYVVNMLIGGGKDGAANVNKFIVENREWNLDEEIAGQGPAGDRYEEIEGTDAKYYNYGLLGNVTLEINNACVYSEKNKDKAYFRDVTMKGSSSCLTGVHVNGKLAVEDKGTVGCPFIYEVETDGDVTAEIIGVGGFKGVTLNAADVLGNINATGNVNAKNSINGNILNATNVTAQYVIGSINANGNIVVENSIGGSVTTEGNVEAKYIGGDVKTKADVTVTTITGDVEGANINVTKVTGDIAATGDVNVTTVGGSINGVNVSARTVGGNVTATGNVTVTVRVEGNVVLENKLTETATLDVKEITGDVTLKGNGINFFNAEVAGNVTIEGSKNVLLKDVNIAKTLALTGKADVTTASSSKDMSIKNITIAEKATITVWNKVTTETITNAGLLEAGNKNGKVGEVYYTEHRGLSNSGTVKGIVEPFENN